MLAATRAAACSLLGGLPGALGGLVLEHDDVAVRDDTRIFRGLCRGRRGLLAGLRKNRAGTSEQHRCH